MIRIFFPALYNTGRTSLQLSRQEKADFYNKVLRPAAVDSCFEAGGSWPSTYDDELFRARGDRNGFALGTKIIAEFNLDDFNDRLLHHLHTIPWGKGAMFMTQVRGLKDGTYHDPTYLDARAALERFLDNLDTSSGLWFIDVGLELSEQGKAYQWRTNGHRHVVRSVLGVSEAQANRMTNTDGRHYAKDPSSHFTDLAGFRLTPSHMGPYKVHYIQLYTTDKSPIYHQSSWRSAKHITGNMAMIGGADGLPTYVSQLYEVYNNAKDTLDCAARVEVRVPLDHALDVLLDFEREIQERALVAFKRKDWWSVFINSSWTQQLIVVI
jgi:hypothetical protein